MELLCKLRRNWPFALFGDEKLSTIQKEVTADSPPLLFQMSPLSQHLPDNIFASTLVLPEVLGSDCFITHLLFLIIIQSCLYIFFTIISLNKKICKSNYKKK